MKDVFACVYLFILCFFATGYFLTQIGIQCKTPTFTNTACILFSVFLHICVCYSIYYSIKTIKESIN